MRARRVVVFDDAAMLEEAAAAHRMPDKASHTGAERSPVPLSKVNVRLAPSGSP
ncbi:MAG: hypothetical protein RX316_02985 [bacterium]|nr:hypothetical protein [bacterium]